MQRRTVLRAAGVTATVGLSGCLGYTIESEDDVERRKDRIDELESDVDELESDLEQKESENEELGSEIEGLETDVETLEAEIEDKETRIQELESTIDQKDDEVDSLESDLDTERREKISLVYELGYQQRNRALNHWKSGSNLYDQADYAGASNEWGISSGQYIDSAETFAEAASQARDLGLSKVASDAESSEEFVRASARAANHFALASYYYSKDDVSEGDYHIDEGNDALDESQQYTLYEPSEIDAALGL